MTDDEKEVVKARAEAAMKPIGNLLESLLGGPFKQIGGMWEDALKLRRDKRKVKIDLEFERFVREAGFEPRQIPDNIAIPALSYAWLQDDESLQSRWAALLANAADPRDIVSVLPSFTTILSELTARDAQFLDALHDDASKTRRSVQSNLSAIRFREEILTKIYTDAGLSRTKPLIWQSQQFRWNTPDLDADFTEFFLALGTLLRHGLIAETEQLEFAETVLKAKSVLTDPQVTMPKMKTERFYSLTELGVSFVRACQAPSAG